ncbi:18092_t:CDS:2 [Racocetra fulgida]|uniref:18092_t:CDS:1 n=1 Tax=Racocetra fulgida TaxID=60492 RepID=A0A9N8VYL1_9GLOM|nr:18092_t:CDS:2 [Racocetra fulgida]
MDALIPNNYVHITGGKDLEITTGIPCKITNEGHYLDNGGGTYGSYVTLRGNSYDRNDPNYSRQIWFIVESTNFGKYRISSNGNYLDTFGGANASECRMSYENHCDNPYYSRQLWTFLNQNISESEKVQIQNLSNKCYLDNWANQYSIVRFSSYFNKPTDSFYSRQLWKFEIADYKLKAEIEAFKYDKKINNLDSYATKVSSTIFASRNQSHSGSCKIELTLSEKTHNITTWSFNKSKEITFLNKLDVDIKAEYAGVKGNLPEVIEWDNKTTSLETIKKIKLDETNVSGKYSIVIQNKEEVEVKIIWHKINLDIQFTATAKIKGFSDRLRKNGSIAKMEQVDVNALLCFLSNSGFEGTIIGTEGNNILAEITGNVNIQGALKYEIENQIYDEWKKRIPVLDKYFCNEDKENKTANQLSSRCESAIYQLALTSKYNNLISNIWDALKKGVAYVMDKNPTVKEYTDVTIKNMRPDLLVWIKNILVFKAEEKAEYSNFDGARQGLLEKMGNWNNSFYGPVPYLLSYAAGGKALHFSDFEILKEAYTAISKSKYAVFAKREPQLKASRGFSQTYFVQLTPVCHKRLPHNEREL